MVTTRRKIRLTPKQIQALTYLRSPLCTELLYGGSAGGGKSFLGCYWLTKNCIKYPGTRWVMGRSVLKTLKETTLNSFYDVSRKLGLKQKQDWVYNAQSNIITFKTGSEILLKDLFQYPSDPDFDELGSLEITGAFVDECNQVVQKAWEVLKSRIRYKLDENDLVPTIMGSCNPSKNWVKSRFYDPWKRGDLSDGKIFIPAKVTDNAFISRHYEDNLKSLSDPASRARLLDGDWEYDNNPNCLCGKDAIAGIFGNNVGKRGKKYITADIARFGSDKAVIMVWDGYVIIEIVTFNISKTTDIQSAMQALRVKHGIPKDRCIADEDGVGGGVVDNLDIKGFVNNSTPLVDPDTSKKEEYYNLQSQMGYALAKVINAREVLFEAELSSDEKSAIQSELEQLQTWETDKDRKLRIKPKKEIKTDLGHSPDYRDTLLMRMWFDYVDTDPQDLTQFF